MPSALRASRDYLSHAIARVRSGLGEYERQTRQPGPEIKVEPFDSHNVSTPAALIKLGTSIAASRRHKANLVEAQKDVELEREKNREQIALIRAQTKYALGEGRTTGEGPAILTKGPYAGMTGPEAGTILATERIKDARAAAADRNRRIGRVSAAQAGIKLIDASVARESEDLTTEALASYARTFQAASAGDKASLVSLEIDSRDYEDSTGPQRSQLLAAARQRVYDGLLRLSTQRISKSYQLKRDKYQSIVDQGVEGFEPEPEAEGDLSDVLQIRVP